MALPPEPISRSIRNLSEIVVVRWSGEWIQAIQYLSKRRRDSEHDELLYKRALAYWARYPEEEWWRITSIKPVTAGDELLELEITFLNPGKALEHKLAFAEPFDDAEDLIASIPSEVISLLRSKLNTSNGSALHEVRPEQPDSQPSSQRP